MHGMIINEKGCHNLKGGLYGTFWKDKKGKVSDCIIIVKV